MKLLLDQNVSYKLVEPLQQQFPGTSHVRLLGLEQALDVDVWQYAQDHNFVMVSKDADMMDLCVFRGAPPKLVWLRLGNCPTATIRDVLLSGSEAIAALAADPGRVYISLFKYQPVE